MDRSRGLLRGGVIRRYPLRCRRCKCHGAPRGGRVERASSERVDNGRLLMRRPGFWEDRRAEAHGNVSQVKHTMKIETADARQLGVEVAGDGLRVVLLQLGSPSAGVIYDRWVRDAAARGLTLIAYDRRGTAG